MQFYFNNLIKLDYFDECKVVKIEDAMILSLILLMIYCVKKYSKLLIEVDLFYTTRKINESLY
jgi:hypothetical protein